MTPALHVNFSKGNDGRTNLRPDTDTSAAWMLNNAVPLITFMDPQVNIAYYHSGYEQL